MSEDQLPEMLQYTEPYPSVAAVKGLIAFAEDIEMSELTALLDKVIDEKMLNV